MPKLSHIDQFLAINFIVGAVELTLELTATRIVAPYIGLNIYVWTSVIGVILASLALGYIFGGQLADKRKNKMDIVYLLLLAAITIGIVNITKTQLLATISQLSIPLQFQALLASCFLFAYPTIILGSISPYLARLSVTRVSNSGTQVSRIYAAGTLGALFGTFFTGFYLFSLVGTRNILSLLLVLLVITSFFVETKRFSKLRLLLIIIALLSLPATSKISLSGVTADVDTSYGRYLVRDVGPIRALQGDSLSWQSAIYRKTGTATSAPDLPYIKLFEDVSTLPPTQNNYLIIGGGAYTFPDTLEHSHPESNITVVEIDNGLYPLSQKYFGFTPTPNLHIVNQDGRQYINRGHGRYDMIYLDAFSNSTPPFQLLSWQATSRIKSLLSDNGVVAINILSAITGPGAQYSASIAKTYRASFADVRLFRVDKTISPSKAQSVLLLASKKSLQPAINSLAMRNPEFKAILSRKITYNSAEGVVLSDDFAPVEQMVAQQE